MSRADTFELHGVPRPPTDEEVKDLGEWGVDQRTARSCTVLAPADNTFNCLGWALGIRKYFLGEDYPDYWDELTCAAASEIDPTLTHITHLKGCDRV
jgi:hypothetical protein